MTGALYVGTSGFAFPEWKGSFYPEGLKDREMLGFYSTVFGTVEINYTFRRFPVEKTLQTWLDTTPEGFVFALKANQRITHWGRLGDLESATDFMSRAAVLGSRLGPILVQCPPTFALDRGRLEAFLDALPAGPRYAFEFRHPSWVEAKDLLDERGAAWVVAETDGAPHAGDDLGGRSFAYLRLRKDEYGDDELKAWSTRISGVRAAGTDVFCYIKHEDSAKGPAFAKRLIELAG